MNDESVYAERLEFVKIAREKAMIDRRRADNLSQLVRNKQGGLSQDQMRSLIHFHHAMADANDLSAAAVETSINATRYSDKNRSKPSAAA